MTDFSYDASRHLKKGRGKVYDSIVDTIGDTRQGAALEGVGADALCHGKKFAQHCLRRLDNEWRMGL